MAQDRLSLQSLLESILWEDDPDAPDPEEEDTHVYFQPPEGRVMQYPCIVYERDNASVKHADDVPYAVRQRYQVTYIDHDPDSDVIDKLLALPLSAFSRHFATSGLNHDVFVIYH